MLRNPCYKNPELSLKESVFTVIHKHLCSDQLRYSPKIRFCPNRHRITSKWILIDVCANCVDFVDFFSFATPVTVTLAPISVTISRQKWQTRKSERSRREISQSFHTKPPSSSFRLCQTNSLHCSSCYFSGEIFTDESIKKWHRFLKPNELGSFSQLLFSLVLKCMTAHENQGSLWSIYLEINQDNCFWYI